MNRRLVLAVLGVAAIGGALLLWHFQSNKAAPAGKGSSAKAAAMPTVAARKLPDPSTLVRGSIAGKISDDKQAALAGARVCAIGSSSELADELVREPVCAVADAGGAYRLSNLYPARYIVSASAKSFRPGVHGDRRRPHLALAAGEQKTGIDIALRGGGVEITGMVADVTGGPIANARVRSQAGWWGSDHAIAMTDSDAAGKFSLWVSPGRISLMANADGYAEGSESGRAPGTFEILLTPESSLAGTVVDAATNQPIEGARVTVGSSEWDTGEVTLSDAKGAFRVARLLPGRAVVTAHTERGFGRTEGSVLVGLGQHVDGVTVKLFAAHRITGRVVIAATKQPCPDASVTLQPKEGDQWLEVRRRDDGLQFAEGVLPGTYTPHVRCAGYQPRDRYEPIVIADREPTELVWEVDAGATIRGKVTTKAGAPVVGANLWAQSVGGPPRARTSWGGDQSGPDGAYELAGLKAGSYRIEIQTEAGVPPGEGYRVEVADGATVTKDLVLDDGGTLRGVVVDAQGKPLAGISVSARPLAGRGARWGGEQKSDDSGAFTFESLRAGEYRVTAQRGFSDRLRRPGTSDDDKQGEKISVRENQLANVRLVVEGASGTITGSVIDHAGKPVPDAFVNAARESDAAGARTSLTDVRWAWDERPVITGTDGMFAVTKLAPGNYTIRAYRKGGGEAFAEHVAVGQTTKLQIKLTGSIEGVAKRAGGVPDALEITLTDPTTGFWRNETFYKTAGRFTLRDVPKGNYKLSVSGRGSQKQIEVALAEAEAKTGVVVELDALVTVSGRVIELGSGKPVPGVRMTAGLVTGGGGFSMGPGDDDEQVTDEAGRFKIANAPRGRLRLTGFPKDFRDSDYSFLIAVREVSGDTVDVGDLTIAKRRVKPGDAVGELGVNWADQPDDTPPDKRELKVSFIDPRGPAAKTGLQVGDVLASVDGVDITGGNAGHSGALLRAPPGTKLTLGLARGATITVVLAAP